MDGTALQVGDGSIVFTDFTREQRMVQRLCRCAGLSRSALYRLFEEEGGVHVWIRERRLERVAEALRCGGPALNVGALAERWGFCDAAYLGRVFRETHGMTPGGFRAERR